VSGSTAADGATSRVAGPRPVPPSRWALDPRLADEDGVVGVGADLEVGTLVDAYRRGIFPWPHEGVPLLWFSPDPRAVIPPRELRVSRSLRSTLRRSGWTSTLSRELPAVMRACADRAEGTWITPEMRDAYEELWRLGWVHSVEIWEGRGSTAELVGGVYGVLVGGVFTGESMFHRRTDASKVALLDLCDRLVEADGVLLDVQLPTAHLTGLGARTMPREDFLALLAAQGAQGARCALRDDRLEVARLASR
jgi:leucyl/phenylalanyl-tRNA---protein transferase